MNYRHAYHAGNFADVVKHVVLTRILAHLAAKPKPFRFIDTHAGIGLYDLSGVEAGKTGEWRSGVGLMDAPFDPEVETLLAPWRQAFSSARERYGQWSYPGSPAIALGMLRADDRAILIEKHPEDRMRLARHVGRNGRAKVLELDGWLSLGGFIPPKERRGLVFIDPPFEEPGEFARCGDELLRANKRWPTGILALWYPIKRQADRDALSLRMAKGNSPVLRIELELATPDDTKLAGTGLIVVNPPWTLAAETATVLPALAARLAPRARWSCDHLVPEHEAIDPAIRPPRRATASPS